MKVADTHAVVVQLKDEVGVVGEVGVVLAARSLDAGERLLRGERPAPSSIHQAYIKQTF